jgi:hypothetical protein
MPHPAESFRKRKIGGGAKSVAAIFIKRLIWKIPHTKKGSHVICHPPFKFSFLKLTK